MVRRERAHPTPSTSTPRQSSTRSCSKRTRPTIACVFTTVPSFPTSSNDARHQVDDGLAVAFAPAAEATVEQAQSVLEGPTVKGARFRAVCSWTRYLTVVVHNARHSSARRTSRRCLSPITKHKPPGHSPRSTPPDSPSSGATPKRDLGARSNRTVAGDNGDRGAHAGNAHGRCRVRRCLEDDARHLVPPFTGVDARNKGLGIGDSSNVAIRSHRSQRRKRYDRQRYRGGRRTGHRQKGRLLAGLGEDGFQGRRRGHRGRFGDGGLGRRRHRGGRIGHECVERVG